MRGMPESILEAPRYSIRHEGILYQCILYYMKLFKIYRGGILKDSRNGILYSVLYRVSYRVYAIQGVRGVSFSGWF